MFIDRCFLLKYIIKMRTKYSVKSNAIAAPISIKKEVNIVTKSKEIGATIKYSY